MNTPRVHIAKVQLKIPACGGSGFKTELNMNILAGLCATLSPRLYDRGGDTVVLRLMIACEIDGNEPWIPESESKPSTDRSASTSIKLLWVWLDLVMVV